MQLTPHITLEDMQQSHHGIDNTCPDNLKSNLQKSANKLEEARKILSDAAKQDCYVRVTYGYRCPAENTACGSTSTTSAHLEALGSDHVPDPKLFTLRAAWDVLRKHSTFMNDIDQLIIERGCIHIGLATSLHTTPRHELRLDKDVTNPDGSVIRTYPLWAIWPNEGKS